MPLIATFDGGGSKTDCLLADADGRVLGRGAAGAASLMHRGEGAVSQALRDAAIAATEAAGLDWDTARRDVAAVCAGMAGAGRERTAAIFQQLLRADFPSAAIRVVVDARIALEGALDGAPGIIVISGTGSIAFGRDAAGREVRVGGWGPDASDEGSGTAIGRAAVAVVFEAFDGRLPAAAVERLRRAILRAWELSDEDDLVERMRTWSAAGRRVPFAELLPVVVAAAEDPAAATLLRKAGEDLAALAEATVRQLGLPDAPIATAGGVFAHAPLVRSTFVKVLNRALPDARVQTPQGTPLEGALRLARELLEGTKT
jgi:glucosamine kinase